MLAGFFVQMATGAVSSVQAIEEDRAASTPSCGDDDDGCLTASIAEIEPGGALAIPWGYDTVMVRRRTVDEIEAVRSTPLEVLIDPEPDAARAHDPEWLVVVTKCTHAGCRTVKGLGDYGGWYCFCHGSQFDQSGRVRKGPAAKNLLALPYEFFDEDMIRIFLPADRLG